jgi:hypothetical protein
VAVTDTYADCRAFTFRDSTHPSRRRFGPRRCLAEEWEGAQRFTNVRYVYALPICSIIRRLVSMHQNVFLLSSYATIKITQKKAISGASATLATPPFKPTPADTAVASATKKKRRTTANKKPPPPPPPSNSGGAGSRPGVLGGADYVEIMMGSRRREREEALKLARDSPPPN